MRMMKIKMKGDSWRAPAESFWRFVIFCVFLPLFLARKYAGRGKVLSFSGYSQGMEKVGAWENSITFYYPRFLPLYDYYKGKKGKGEMGNIRRWLWDVVKVDFLFLFRFELREHVRRVDLWSILWEHCLALLWVFILMLPHPRAGKVLGSPCTLLESAWWHLMFHCLVIPFTAFSSSPFSFRSVCFIFLDKYCTKWKFLYGRELGVMTGHGRSLTKILKSKNDISETKGTFLPWYITSFCRRQAFFRELGWLWGVKCSFWFSEGFECMSSDVSVSDKESLSWLQTRAAEFPGFLVTWNLG